MVEGWIGGRPRWEQSPWIFQPLRLRSSHGAKQIIHLMISAFNIRPFTGNRELTTHSPSPSSHVTPKKMWSLVVSQTEESTNRLRAVPKVSMLLSAMEEAYRRLQAILINRGRTEACKNDRIIKNGKKTDGKKWAYQSERIQPQCVNMTDC